MSNWINVEDRLPEDEDKYLVTCQTKSGRKSINLAWCDSSGIWHGMGGMAGVIAWMELPEPYEGDPS